MSGARIDIEAANGSLYRPTAMQFSKAHSPALSSVVEVILLSHGHAIVIDQVRTILLHADGRPLVYRQAPIVTSTRRNMSARTRRSPS
jgi:hypothetical protein